MNEGTADPMDVFKINVKLPATGFHAAVGETVEAFHSLIRRQAMPGHVLIDVANYSHVHNGPGVLLVAHEANLSLDTADGMPGLTYARKQPFDAADLAGRITQAIDAVFLAADELEKEPALAGKVAFDRRSVQIRFNDRLLTPNTPQTIQAVEPAVLRAVRARLGDAATLACTGPGRHLLAFLATA